MKFVSLFTILNFTLPFFQVTSANARPGKSRLILFLKNLKRDFICLITDLQTYKSVKINSL